MPTMTKKRARLMPTMRAGEQFQQPVQQVPEEIVAVGARTGKPYFQMGDNPNGPEMLTITPPRGTIASSVAPDDVVLGRERIPSYATGGQVLVGPGGRTREQITGTDYLSDEEREWYLSGGSNLGAEAQTWLNNRQASAPAPATIASSVAAPAAVAATDPLANQLAARQATQGVQQQVINATGGVIAANQGVLSARQGTIAPSQAVINANAGVNTATGQYIAADRQNIAQQQAANQARRAEIVGIQNAQNNVADLIAVARAQTARNDEAYKYGLAGISQPTEVDLPNGADASSLPPGVRGRLMTQAQLLERNASNAEALRSLELDQARLALSLVGTNVDAARLEAAKAGLTLDQAQLVVEQAQIAAGQAGLTLDQYQNQLSQARLNEDIAGTPPQSGLVLYVDPTTGRSEYITQAQADIRETVYRNQGQMMYDPSTNSYAPAELGALTDSQVAAAAGDGVITTEVAIGELLRRGYSQAAAEHLVSMASAGGGTQIDVPSFSDSGAGQGSPQTPPAGGAVTLPPTRPSSGGQSYYNRLLDQYFQ